MAQIIYDLVDLAELTQYTRSYNDEVLRSRFVLDRILPNVQVEDLEFQVRAGSLQDVDVAEFRSWDTQPGMADRPGLTRKRGELPPVSRQIPLTEEESLRLRALERGSNDPLVPQIFNDAERMTRAVQARVELSRGDLLTDGIVTIVENGLNLTVDFGVAGSHKPALVGTAQWTTANAATAVPITNLLTWSELYEADSGVAAAGMLMSRQRLAGLLVNAEVRAYVQSGMATMPSRVNLAQLNDVLAEHAIPPIVGLTSDVPGAGVFYDQKVRVGGVSTPVIPPEYVVFLPPEGEPLGSTFYGLTAEATRLVERSIIERQDAPGLVTVVLQNDNPVQTFTLSTAIALPTIVNPELFFTAKVA